MNKRRTLLSAAGLFLVCCTVSLAAPVLPPGDNEPLLRLEAKGPTSFVTSLAFTSDGKTLYVAGFDKVVRRWHLDEKKGEFVLDEKATYRIPIGPGLDGAINTIALSHDKQNRWLAVGGLGVLRAATGFRQNGRLFPMSGFLDDELRQDMGMIYVFDTVENKVRLLRGNTGAVEGLAFAFPHPQRADKPPLLVSCARERGKGLNFHGTLRLWDLAVDDPTKALIATVSDLPAPFRPGLTAWNTGEAATDVRAALADGDGQLRVWDADPKGGQIRKTAEADETVAVASLPDEARLLTAIPGPGQVGLKRWRVGVGEPPQVQLRAAVPDGKWTFFPRALGLVSSKADGKPDHAAVVIREPPKPGPETNHDYHLQLLNLADKEFGAVKGQVALWKGRPNRPALATAPNGRYVAVAGNDSHDIRIYLIADLLRGAKEPKVQTLRSAGTIVRRVTFVASQGDSGLLLSLSAPNAKPVPRLVLDFTNRSLTDKIENWKLTPPEFGKWNVKDKLNGKQTTITIHQGIDQIAAIKLPEEFTLSDYALLPPTKLKIPLLAVAMHKGGQPQLRIYNAKSGEWLRQCTGHESPLTSLAFSPDGRLLASASEDQTVCLWSLTDLDKHLDRHGVLPGLAVRQVKGQLVVEVVEKDSEASKKLRVEDVLAGLVENGKLRKFDSPLAFYDAIDQMEPNKKIVVRRGDPQGKDDVTLTTGQGTDERKPLCTLFVTEADRAGKREWIAWSRLGSYDASSLPAEEFVGWHFNRGDPQKPTAFAAAKEYHNTYYREGFLKELVKRASDVPPKDKVPPEPQMTLRIIEEGRLVEAGPGGQVRITRPRATATLTIDNCPFENLESLTWRVDGGAAQDLDLKYLSNHIWDLPLHLERGVHNIEVVAKGIDQGPSYRKSLTVRYQPPTPLVKLKGAATTLEVKEADFEVQATITPGAKGEDVQISLLHRHGEKDLLKETSKDTPKAEQSISFVKTLKLKPGTNLIEIVAHNDKALSGYESEETTRQWIKINLIVKAKSPTLTLQQIEPLLKGQTLNPISVADPTKTIEVKTRRIRLIGEISSTEKLSLAEQFTTDPMKAVKLTQFIPDKQMKLAIAEEIELRPGLQVIHLRTASPNSDVKEDILRLRYIPETAAIQMTEPVDGTTVHGSEEAKTIRLRARLTFPEDKQDYEAVVLVNGKARGQKPVIDEKTGTLTADIPLTPLDNRIEVKFRNQWEGGSSSGEVLVWYRRPPKILKMEEIKEGVKSVILARVRSPLPLKLDSVRVTVNGDRVNTGSVTIEKEKDDTSIVRLKDVPRVEGSEENRVEFWISNDESANLEPGAITIRGKIKPIIQLQLSQRVSSNPWLDVQVKVESDTPLQKVQVIRQGADPFPIKEVNVKPNGQGIYELTKTVTIKLARGENELYAEATNANGTQSTSRVVVSHTQPAARLEIVQIVPQEGGKAIAPKPDSNELVFDEKVNQSQVRLYGRVVWGDGVQAAEQRRRIQEIRVYVNGCQQISNEDVWRPKAEDKDSTAFEVKLLLTRPENNQVRVMVPGLAQEKDNKCEFTLHCTKPEKFQRYHLLILSVRESDPTLLEKRVRKSLHLAAEPGVFVNTVTGDQIRSDHLKGRFFQIQRNILQQSTAQPGSDVVIIYFEGSEKLTAEGNIFQADSNEGSGRNVALDFNELVAQCTGWPGAYILFFDVARKKDDPRAGKDKIADLRNYYPEPNLAVLRYLWGTTPAKVAPGDSLLTALEKALGNAQVFSQMTQDVHGFAEGIRKKKIDLRDDQQFHEDLKRLPVGRGK